jgi:hypothetical protein
MRWLVMALAVAAAPAVIGAQAGQAPTETRPASEGNQSTAASPAHSFQVSGWTRTSLEVTLPGESNGAAAPGIGVPHDEVLARELLYVRTRYSHGRSFEATGAALLTFGLFQGGDFYKSNDALRRDARVEVREAYVGFSVKAFDIRAGIQRIAWGHGDIFSPNDVLNARDTRDPLLNETELKHVPTLALRGDVELPGGSLRLVGQPLFESDRYDVYGSNWAFVQAGAPAGFRGLLGALTAHPGPSRRRASDALLFEPPRPKALSGTQAGVRFDWHIGRFDVTHYYHYGFHGTPKFRVERFAVAALDAVDWANTPAVQIEALVLELNGAGAMGSAWERRQHVGLDVGTTAGPFVLRLDAAYQQPALFYDRTFNGWLSPAIETAVGLEYQTGTLGRTIVIEGRHRHILATLPEGGLLFAARDSVDAALLARWTWTGVELETRGVAGLGPRSFVLRPQITLKNGGLGVSGGVAILGGEVPSYGGWYRRNRSVYLTLRKDF